MNALSWMKVLAALAVLFASDLAQANTKSGSQTRLLDANGDTPSVVGRAASFGDLFSAGFKAPTSSRLSPKEGRKAERGRTCVKSFPWTPTEREALRDTLQTPDVLAHRIDRTRDVIANKWRAKPTQHEWRLLAAIQAGRDPETVILYGEFLLARALFRTGNYAELAARVVPLSLEVTRAELEAGPDNGSGETLFRRSELVKMLGALRDQSLLRMGRLEGDEAIAALERLQYLEPYANIFAGGASEYGTFGAELLSRLSRDGIKERIGTREFLFLRGGERIFVGYRRGVWAKWRLLAPDKVDKLLQAELDEVANTQSTAHTEVWTVVPFGESARVTRPGSVHEISVVSADALNELLTAPNQNGRSAAVLYVPEFVRVEGRALSRRMIVRAQHENTTLKMFLDDPTPTAVPNAEAAAGLTVGGPLTAVVPKDFGVLDGRVLQNLQDRLTPVVFDGVAAWSRDPGETVLVISGHSAPELQEYVRQLAKAGVFRKNHVIFASCGTALTEALRSEILLAGAASVLTFDDKITNENVHDLVDEVLNLRENAPGEGLMDVLIRRSNELGLRGVWQVSDVVRKTRVRHV